jgi:hypothetical protein
LGSCCALQLYPSSSQVKIMIVAKTKTTNEFSKFSVHSSKSVKKPKYS